jgi:hypothetical protein
MGTHPVCLCCLKHWTFCRSDFASYHRGRWYFVEFSFRFLSGLVVRGRTPMLVSLPIVPPRVSRQIEVATLRPQGQRGADP